MNHQPPNATSAKTINAKEDFLEGNDMSGPPGTKGISPLSDRSTLGYALIGKRIGLLIAPISRVTLDPMPMDVVSAM